MNDDGKNEFSNNKKEEGYKSEEEEELEQKKKNIDFLMQFNNENKQESNGDIMIDIIENTRQDIAENIKKKEKLEEEIRQEHEVEEYLEHNNPPAADDGNDSFSSSYAFSDETEKKIKDQKIIESRLLRRKKKNKNKNKGNKDNKDNKNSNYFNYQSLEKKINDIEKIKEEDLLEDFDPNSPDFGFPELMAKVNTLDLETEDEWLKHITSSKVSGALRGIIRKKNDKSVVIDDNSSTRGKWVENENSGMNSIILFTPVNKDFTDILSDSISVKSVDIIKNMYEQKYEDSIKKDPGMMTKLQKKLEIPKINKEKRKIKKQTNEPLYQNNLKATHSENDSEKNMSHVDEKYIAQKDNPTINLMKEKLISNPHKKIDNGVDDESNEIEMDVDDDDNNGNMLLATITVKNLDKDINWDEEMNDLKIKHYDGNDEKLSDDDETVNASHESHSLNHINKKKVNIDKSEESDSVNSILYKDGKSKKSSDKNDEEEKESNSDDHANLSYKSSENFHDQTEPNYHDDKSIKTDENKPEIHLNNPIQGEFTFEDKDEDQTIEHTSTDESGITRKEQIEKYPNYIVEPILPIETETYHQIAKTYKHTGRSNTEIVEQISLSSRMLSKKSKKDKNKKLINKHSILERIYRLFDLLPFCIQKAVESCKPNIRKVIKICKNFHKRKCEDHSNVVRLACTDDETFFNGACYKNCPGDMEDSKILCIKNKGIQRKVEPISDVALKENQTYYGDRFIVTKCATFGESYFPISADLCIQRCPYGWKTFGTICMKPYRYKNQKAFFFDSSVD